MRKWVWLVVAGCVLAACSMDGVYRRYTDRARAQAGLVRKTVNLDGATIVYLEGGTGETLVLVHGFSGDKDNWDWVAKYLKSYHLIIPDLPPFGESSRDSAERYDAAAQVDRMHAFLKGFTAQPVFVAGHSMGGEVAGLWAAKYPGDVKGLILIDCGGVDSKDSVDLLSQAMHGRQPNPLIAGNVTEFRYVIAANFAHPPYIPAPLMNYLAQQAIKNQTWNARAFADIKARPSGLEQRLGDLTMPVLIIWGDKDRIIDIACVAVLEKGIKRHRTAIVRDCGHSPTMEKPKETAAIIMDFIARYYPQM